MARKRSEDMIRRPKKLLVCCDGTWENSDSGYATASWFSSNLGKLQTPTNVTRLCRALKTEDSASHPQICYYQAGVGTGLGFWSRLIGGGTGLGFSENVREAYGFLANNYAAGDSIFLAGFSRGAYTARSLAGFIAQLGMLKKEAMQWFSDIFEDWQNAGNSNYTPSFIHNYRQQQDTPDHNVRIKTPANDMNVLKDYLDEYRKLLLSLGLTREVQIKAIGVFDTVGALGIPVNPWLQKYLFLPSFIHSYKWVDTALDKHVEHAFQALALDEHRAPFFPSVWERPERCPTNLKQTWFVGAHSNVGGSYRDISTANITLAWMMDQLSGDSTRHSDPDTFSPRDWLEFDGKYLDEQFRLNELWHKKLSDPRTWAMGIIYDSFTFPQLLGGHANRKPGRTRPTVRDHEINTRLLQNTNEHIHASVRARIDLGGRSYEIDSEAPLAARITYGLYYFAIGCVHKLLGRQGHIYYTPDQRGPLKGWILRDGHEYHDELAVNPVALAERSGDDSEQHHQQQQSIQQPPYWEWTGKDKLVDKGKRLPEDRLGTHELRLLGHYADAASLIWRTNSGLSAVDELRPAEKRRKGSVVRNLTI